MSTDFNLAHTEQPHATQRILTRNPLRQNVADFKYINKTNKDMMIMSQNKMEKHLKTNRDAFKKFSAKAA